MSRIQNVSKSDLFLPLRSFGKQQHLKNPHRTIKRHQISMARPKRMQDKGKKASSSKRSELIVSLTRRPELRLPFTTTTIIPFFDSPLVLLLFLVLVLVNVRTNIDFVLYQCNRHEK